MDWIHLAEVRSQWWTLMNMVMKSSGSIKGGVSLDWLSNYKLLKKDSSERN
jgi:hypothetical protein